MAHTYTRLLVHCVFSTKERRGLIPQQVQPDLWAYMGGIARTNGFVAIAVGGTENHAHALLGIPASLTVAKAVQLIKAGSSKWLGEQKGLRLFGWQEAYGAFTIGASQTRRRFHISKISPHTTRSAPSKTNIGRCCEPTMWRTKRSTCSDDPVSCP
jgi:REP-associated tyrosine transposase